MLNINKYIMYKNHMMCDICSQISESFKVLVIFLVVKIEKQMTYE